MEIKSLIFPNFLGLVFKMIQNLSCKIQTIMNINIRNKRYLNKADPQFSLKLSLNLIHT